MVKIQDINKKYGQENNDIGANLKLIKSDSAAPGMAKEIVDGIKKKYLNNDPGDNHFYATRKYVSHTRTEETKVTDELLKEEFSFVEDNFSGVEVIIDANDAIFKGNLKSLKTINAQIDDHVKFQEAFKNDLVYHSQKIGFFSNSYSTKSDIIPYKDILSLRRKDNKRYIWGIQTGLNPETLEKQLETLEKSKPSTLE